MLLRSNLTLLGLKSRPKKEKAVQLFRQTAFIHKLAPRIERLSQLVDDLREG